MSNNSGHAPGATSTRSSGRGTSSPPRVECVRPPKSFSMRLSRSHLKRFLRGIVSSRGPNNEISGTWHRAELQLKVPQRGYPSVGKGQRPFQSDGSASTGRTTSDHVGFRVTWNLAAMWNALTTRWRCPERRDRAACRVPVPSGPTRSREPLPCASPRPLGRQAEPSTSQQRRSWSKEPLSARPQVPTDELEYHRELSFFLRGR